MNNWIVPVLALSLFACAAALLVAIAKWQEEKERRWDEISRAVDLENKLDKAKRECEQAVLFWRDTAEESVEYEIQRDALQDRLSALLCHHNDHVWRDGVCVKCGRMKDA